MYILENQLVFGSVIQVRDVIMQFLKIVKIYKIIVVIVGYVIKDGFIVGLRVLEYMVDCVLYFEGERFNIYRVIRVYKNRFGFINQFGIFEMIDGGFVEVKNFLSIFLESFYNVEGVVIYLVIEGIRFIFLEIQVFSILIFFGMLRRIVIGIDYNRCVMFCVVFEKKIGFVLSIQDIYVNVVGGFKVLELVVDFVIVCVIVLSYKGIFIGDIVLIGEVGLIGEIRVVFNIEKRLNEVKKLGFKRVIILKRNMELI